MRFHSKAAYKMLEHCRI
ncbi:hypothetical protein PybrP1_007962, partial [[Pythium] brassicae (nom. inval.)]